MSTFELERTLKLDRFGEHWKDCYIIIKDLDVGTVEAIQKDNKRANTISGTVDILKNVFVEGKGWNGKEVVPIGKQDLEILPLIIYNAIINFLFNRPTVLNSA